MPSSRTARYIDVLALPQVLLTFGVATIGRAAYAFVFLPLLYAVTEATNSIALAGVAVAIYGAAASFLAPIRASLMDRFGARRVLRILIVVFGGTIAAVAVTSMLTGPGIVLIILAGLAGAFAPPLGPTMRVAWGRLAPTPELLRKGLSLDAVTEELLYLAGPAAAGLALVFIEPGAALLVPAGLVIVGGLLFCNTPVFREMVPTDPSDTHSKRRTSILRRPRFVGMLLPVFVAGAISGTVSVAVPALLAEHGGPAAAGIALGLFAGGSALGGLLYGALKVPGSPARQLVALSTALLVASSALALCTGLVAVGTVLTLAGLFFSPVMIVAYVAAHTVGAENQQNAATTWVNTGHNIGGAAGSAVAGVLIQATSTALTFGVIGIFAALLLVVSAFLGRRP